MIRRPGRCDAPAGRRAQRALHARRRHRPPRPPAARRRSRARSPGAAVRAPARSARGHRRPPRSMPARAPRPPLRRPAATAPGGLRRRRAGGAAPGRTCAAAHAALHDDRRDRASAAGRSGLRDRRLQADQRDASAACAASASSTACGDAITMSLAPSARNSPSRLVTREATTAGRRARVGRVGVVAEQQQVLPGQQPLQGAGDRDPVAVLGQDAHGAVRRQTRGRVFSGS